MRVAHVVSHFGLPSEPFVVDAMQELDAAGWEAWLVTLSVAQRPADADAVHPFPPDERIVCVPEGTKARRFARRVLRSAPERFADAAVPGLARSPPALVHAHFGWSGLLARPVAERLGVPLVVTFHATDVTVYPRLPGWWRLVTGSRHKYEDLFQRIDRAIAVSRFIESRLRALGFEGPVEIVPAGVRLAKFPFRGEPAVARSARLLYVGRLVPRKGLDVLLHALPAVAAADATVGLEVIGEGTSRRDYERLTRRLGLGRRVEFRGAGAPADVLEALRRADVLVVPSRTMPDGEAEGSPVVTKEALAVGVPIVATHSGGLPETIPPAYRHELVPENDPAALAGRIVELLSDRAAWGERARIGRTWLEQEFDWKTLGRRTSAIYAEVCGAQ
jgi:glycosyltransferase involved in cell wall biosynthesis